MRWRYRGHTGRLIRRHRALRSLDVQTSSIVHPLALTIGALALVIFSRNVITRAWADIIAFWCKSTGIEAAVSMRTALAGNVLRYSVPELEGVLISVCEPVSDFTQLM